MLLILFMLLMLHSNTVIRFIQTVGYSIYCVSRTSIE